MPASLKLAKFDAGSTTLKTWPTRFQDNKHLDQRLCASVARSSLPRQVNKDAVKEPERPLYTLNEIVQIHDEYNEAKLNNCQLLSEIVTSILDNFLPTLIDSAFYFTVLEHTVSLLEQYQNRKISIFVSSIHQNHISELLSDVSDEVSIVGRDDLAGPSVVFSFDGCRTEMNFDTYSEQFRHLVTSFLGEKKREIIDGRN